MKWVMTNYKGDEQIWYSGDIIEKIKESLNGECSSTALKVLKIIESEEK